MANELALGLVIGGAVSASVGKAFGDVEGRIKRLDTVAGKTKVLQSVIGDTKRLQDEWRKAHAAGATTADGLKRKLEANLTSLKAQGVAVSNLGKEYERMGRLARSAELRAKGQAQIQQGRTGLRNAAGVVAGTTAAMAIPTKVSAEYGAVVRDIAIKAGVANKPEEAQMSKTIIDTGRATGMARNDVADVVNALVGAGMDLKKALEYAPVASKFVVGQGADGTDTAKMINALGQNAKITDAGEMQKALEAIAFQGQAGSFEAADMAKWFPELLAGMGKLGITGNDAVTQLGAMLQVQMKTAGSSDEAANNLKNWMEKIGSEDVVKSYKDAGIDYQKSLNTGIQKGMSTLESSFALAQKYVETTDPKKAKTMNEAVGKISKETDPEKAKQMLNSLEQALRTGDLFADMQVKAALTAYMQNKQLYDQLKKDSREATGILDKNLAERRETSAQKWKEMSQAMDDGMRSVGDALQPITDVAATALAEVGNSISSLSDKYPAFATGVAGVAAAVAGFMALSSTYKIGKGLLNIGRGSLMGNPNVVQKVEVVNGLPGGAGAGAAGRDRGTGGRAGEGERTRTRRRWPFGRGSAAATAAAETAAVATKPRMRVYSGAPATVAPKPLSRWLPPGVAPIADTAPAAAKPRMQVYAGTTPAAMTAPLSRWVPPGAVPIGSAMSLAGPSGIRPKLPVTPHVGKGDAVSALFDAASQAKDVYDSDGTRGEKAEGYGQAAGGMAGTLAGAAAGAAIGSVVPILGTAVGAMIGGMLGSMGGQSLGGFIGKSLFGDDDAAAATASTAPGPGPAVPSLAEFAGAYNKAGTSAPDMTLAAAAMKAPPAPVGPLMMPIKADAPAGGGSKVEQQITNSPVFHINVQGDVKDPRALVAELMPEIERALGGVSQQSARRNNYDDPHV